MGFSSALVGQGEVINYCPALASGDFFPVADHPGSSLEAEGRGLEPFSSVLSGLAEAPGEIERGKTWTWTTDTPGSPSFLLPSAGTARRTGTRSVRSQGARLPQFPKLGHGVRRENASQPA